MENTGSHAKDELNTKTEDGRVLGISTIITSRLLRNYYVIYSAWSQIIGTLRILRPILLILVGEVFLLNSRICHFLGSHATHESQKMSNQFSKYGAFERRI